MQKRTMSQSIVLMGATDTEKVMYLVEFGFHSDEAEAMVKGSTTTQAYEKYGGIWRVGNVEWAQAISKDHALKLHIWTFGEIDKVNLVRTDHQGLSWIIR